MERGMLRGIGVFRIVQWCWLAGVVLLNRHDLDHAWVAWLLVAASLFVTAVLARELLREPDRLVTLPLLVGEGAVAVTMQFAGGFAYHGDPFEGTHTLGAAWPIAFVLTVAVAKGPLVASACGLMVGSARILQPISGGIAWHDLTASQASSLASTVVLYTLAGGVAGYVIGLLVRAEREVAAARARDDVARTLHDGVLQTLAVIERRADDADLARLAREQERELREFLFGAPTERDLGRALRAAAARCEDAYGARAEVVIAPDLAALPEHVVDAIAGAVGEALTNAGKHGAAQHVVVYVEPETRDERDGVFVSVRDDGCGFNPEHARVGVGLARSIRGRIEEHGGNVEVDSRERQGTEVRLWLPL